MLTTDSKTAPFLQNKNEVKKKIIQNILWFWSINIIMIIINQLHKCLAFIYTVYNFKLNKIVTACQT